MGVLAPCPVAPGPVEFSCHFHQPPSLRWDPQPEPGGPGRVRDGKRAPRALPLLSPPCPAVPFVPRAPSHLVGGSAAREEIPVVVAVQGDVENLGVPVENLLGPIAVVDVLQGGRWERILAAAGRPQSLTQPKPAGSGSPSPGSAPAPPAPQRRGVPATIPQGAGAGTAPGDILGRAGTSWGQGTGLTQSTMRILLSFPFCCSCLAAMATELKKQNPLGRGVGVTSGALPEPPSLPPGPGQGWLPEGVT